MDRFSIIKGLKPPQQEETPLDEIMNKLIDESGVSNLKKFASEEEADAVASRHFHGGQYIRNTFKLWEMGSKYAKYFNSIGVSHPDDMSGIIFTSIHRKLNGKDINLEEQVKKYQKYWEMYNINK
jgi:hypothetical protein